MMRSLISLLRVIRVFFITRSYKRARFSWLELNLQADKMDDNMLIAQLGYFGHHTEKALKHHNRGNRGLFKRKKLEVLLNEALKRQLDEPMLLDWAQRLISHYDNSKEIYIERYEGDRISEHRDEFLTLIKDRTTTRFWLPEEVELDIIEKILETAIASPLSCNRQTVRFAITRNHVDDMVVGDSNNKSMFAKAPVTIYVADDPRFFSEKYGNALDVGGVCSLILVAAKAYGLSGSWIYHSESYEQKLLKKELGFEDYMYIFSSITLGYPLDKQEKPPRCSVKRFIVNAK